MEMKLSERPAAAVVEPVKITEPDISRLPVELLVHAVRDESGKAEFYYCFLTDITERTRINESLRRSRDELELRVQERTAELSSANQVLSAQIAERERQRRRYLLVKSRDGDLARRIEDVQAELGLKRQVRLLDAR